MSTFLEIPAKNIIFRNNFYFCVYDKYPVSPGHLLIISNIVYENYFSLPKDHQTALIETLEKAKMVIEETYSPDGYNIGMNCGVDAGQTVMHFHCHLIPRYKNDVPNPRGGVRHAVMGKGYY